jgi:hypothetical protein
MKMATIFKLMRDLFFIGEKVMMHGQLQIIPQTSLLNQFLKLSMV